jgi:Glycosyltransferase 61
MSASTDLVRNQAIARFNDIAGRARSSVRPQAADFQFKRNRIFYAPNKGVAEIPNAIVLSGEWFVLMNELVICDAFTQTPFPPFSAYHMGQPYPGYIDLIYPSPVSLSHPKAFLLGGCPNYSHWLMDYLPRLSLWRDDVPLLINGGMRSFQIESLQALGVEADKLRELEYPNAYLFQSLLFPSLNSSWSSAPPLSLQPSIIQWLRSRFESLFEMGSARHRIFITRAGERGGPGRRLLNSGEIEDIARKYDFEIVACETMSFVEQVKLFSQASVVAGVHGAGLVNIVFAPKETRVIELIGPRGGHPATELEAYRQLAGFMNLEFSRAIGRSDMSAPIENDHLVNELFSIDPTEFAAALDRL